MIVEILLFPTVNLSYDPRKKTEGARHVFLDDWV
jgi:hypothetical protein